MPAPLSPGITAATLNVSKSLQSRFIYSNRLTLEHSQVQYIREQGFINISNGILSSFECHGNTEAAPLPSDTHLRACMLANSYSHSHTHTHTHTHAHTHNHTHRPGSSIRIIGVSFQECQGHAEAALPMHQGYSHL